MSHQVTDQKKCATCGDDGLVELPEGEGKIVAGYLAQGLRHDPRTGDELITMLPCPDCLTRGEKSDAATLSHEDVEEMMYEVHFRRCFTNEKDYALIASGLTTLQEARDARKIAGDLVVEAATKKIVVDDSWLWEWEKGSACYAKDAINWQRQANGKMAPID